MGAIGYNSRITVNRTKTSLSPVQKIAVTRAAQETLNRVDGTDFFFKRVLADMAENIKYMGIGYFENEDEHKTWNSNINPVGVSGTPEIIVGDDSVNNGAPTIRFKFHLTSDIGTMSLSGGNNIHYVLMDTNSSITDNNIWFYINTGSTGFSLGTGESQVINWEIYFRSGKIGESQ